MKRIQEKLSIIAFLGLCSIAASVPVVAGGSPTQFDFPVSGARQERQTADVKAGGKAINAGDFVAAEADFRSAIADDSPGGFDYYGLAVALTGEGRTAEAMQAYHTVFYDLPIEDCASGDPAAVAASRAEKAQSLQSDPVGGASFGSDTPDAAMRYALLLCQAGQSRQAVLFYERALPELPRMEIPLDVHFDPNTPLPSELEAAAHIGLGQLADFGCGSFALGYDHDRALSEFRQAVRLAPDADLTNYYCAYGLRMATHGPGARAEYIKALKKTLKIAHGTVKDAVQKALAE